MCEMMEWPLEYVDNSKCWRMMVSDLDSDCCDYTEESYFYTLKNTISCLPSCPTIISWEIELIDKLYQRTTCMCFGVGGDNGGNPSFRVL